MNRQRSRRSAKEKFYEQTGCLTKSHLSRFCSWNRRRGRAAALLSFFPRHGTRLDSKAAFYTRTICLFLPRGVVEPAPCSCPLFPPSAPESQTQMLASLQRKHPGAPSTATLDRQLACSPPTADVEAEASLAVEELLCLAHVRHASTHAFQILQA
jgi:hypothetical protein